MHSKIPAAQAPAGGVSAVLGAIPAVRMLRGYDRSWLRPDLLAALTVWAVLVPQALAYAQLAGLDPAVGLYASIGAGIGYALLGGVREMSVGPEGTIALLTATVIGPLAGGDAGRYTALAATLALAAGGLLLLAAAARLGFVTSYLSRPLLVGYVAGSAIVMIVSQLDSMLGIKLVAQDDTLAELFETVRRIPETHLPTLVTGITVIAIVLAVRAINRRLPAYLVAVIAAIAASVALGLADRGVAVVGALEGGLPRIGLPAMELGDLRLLIGPAMAIALLVYADSGVTGQVLGRRGGYRVEPNGEFLGLGAANIGSALTGGFPVNGSQSRSFTAADLGARSQVAGLGVVVAVVVTLLFLTPLFTSLPKAALAGIIIVVAMGLLDPAEFRALARIDRSEAGLAVLAAAIVVGVGMLVGVVAVVILSLLLVAQRAARPRTTLLVRVPGTDSFRGEGTEGGEAVPGMVLYRFEAPLFFANADQLRADIESAVAAADPPARWVVIDCQAITSVDSTATAMLGDLVEALRADGITVALARLSRPVAGYLDRAGVLGAIGRANVHLEVDDAVAAFAAAGR